MKIHPARSSRSASGFTLIELITVIAIISILMALLFPQIQSAREQAYRQEAATVVRNVVNAANSYKQDYGKYPPIAKAENQESKFRAYGDSSASQVFKTDNRELLDVLRAIPREGGENVEHALNFRQVKYYENKKATDGKNPRNGFADGSEFKDNIRGNLMDPWGIQYCFILETDGDEVLDLSKVYTDLTGTDNYVRFGAVGISAGKSKKLGGRDYENMLRKPKSTEPPDDIVSWQ